jgi:SAM-dependent methyltransferase
MHFLEIGCAPGKILAWVAQVLRAEVAGVDYSERGLDSARHLFLGLGIVGDLRCEDIFRTTFKSASFDIVFSAGVIEHFENPSGIVQQHVRLAKPGGKVIITIPNYGGIWGRVQRYFDPENLAIHNLAIMQPPALQQILVERPMAKCYAYPSGRVSPWLISFNNRWPPLVARSMMYFLNGVGLLQPLDIAVLCPMLVLEIRCLP